VDLPTIKKFLHEAGATSVMEYTHNKHLQISCLLAPWTHKKPDGSPGTDHNPSCSISYRDEVAKAHCFTASCGFGGSFVRYLENLNYFRKGEISTLVENARYYERGDLLAKIDALTTMDKTGVSHNNKVKEMLEVWSEDELRSLERKLKPKYLVRKSIDIEVAKKYLLWDEGAQAMAIPVRRWDGKLVGVVERCWCAVCQQFQKCGGQKYKNAINFVKSRYLFNEYMLDRKDKANPVFVVEGIFDVLKMITAGYASTVAIFGTSLSDDQAIRLKSMSRPVALMFDGDADGRKCTMESMRKLKGMVPTLLECPMPDGKDPGDLPLEDLKKIANSPRGVL
jgi:hypothetical protein